MTIEQDEIPMVEPIVESTESIKVVSTPKKLVLQESSDSIQPRPVWNLSPSKSPGKRGIIKLSPEKGINSLFSPVKTPNGRAGLISPVKRSSDAINRSARKRAVNSSMYSRLMDELDNDDGSDPNDALTIQESNLADIIIKSSRDDGDFRGYGSDVEFEEDLTLASGKRTRRKKVSYDEDDDDEEDDEELDDTDTNEGDLDSGEELDDNEFEAPKKRQTRTRTRTTKSPRTLKRRRVKAKRDPNSAKTSVIRRSKMGRPTKAEGVVGKIKSIFHEDDELLFKDNARLSRSGSPSSKPNGKDPYNDSLISDTLITIPVISGIEKLKTDAEQETEKLEFVPLPIPKTDSSGVIIDKEFLDTYFSGKAFEDISKGRFLDEKAFFLEGSEGYFEQHSGRTTLSSSSLSQMAPSIDYSQFIPLINLCGAVSKNEKDLLINLHKILYHQWCFELSQGFNLLFYGVGSKIDLLSDFAENYFGDWFNQCYNEDMPAILAINGFNPSLNFKTAIQEIVSVFIPKNSPMHSSVPKHVSETVPFLINHLASRRTSNPKPKLVLLIHNIDGKSFRDEKTQNLLSQLCSVPEIWVITSVDNINSPLMWDMFKLKNYNFLWHDLTTFSTYSIESSFRDVLSMGRSKKLAGDSGTKYVLSSLTSNHRNLYRILLDMQINNLKGSATSDASRNVLKGTTRSGVEMKALYEACVEQFITSNEITFRTLLGEYVEHKMCKLVKDDSGLEKVFIPFRYDEMQKIMKDEFAV
ncbi:origin recognition complex subunit 2 [Scheffersomyces coipomensis]|uniref:origin recognition complex subunit 2 n=1 Tax=Scheffersomyces coipomensis TaxID=1788519 RepID=UPI00315CA672